jgi:pyrroloquinoline quinone biosynthesis protein B
VFLTHAHAGHYPGILYFGKEGQNTSELPLYASESMHSFLSSNEPWGVMYRNRNLFPVFIQDGVPIALSPSLQVTPHSIVHRADFTDTFAFTITGKRHLYFCPDIDSWTSMESELVELARHTDFLLLDATFYDDWELSGRDMSSIPHPRVTDTVQRLQSEARKCREERLEATMGEEQDDGVADDGSSRDDVTSTRRSSVNQVVLIHMNHSNRLWASCNEQDRIDLEQQGFDVGRCGMRWKL